MLKQIKTRGPRILIPLSVIFLLLLSFIAFLQNETQVSKPGITESQTKSEIQRQTPDTSKAEQTEGITLEEALDMERRGDNPQIAIKVIGPAEVFPGTMIVYTIEYTSTGMGTAKDITIQITFPEGSEEVLSVGHATPGWTGRVQLTFMVPPLTPIGTVLEARVEARFKNLNNKPLASVSTTFQTTLKRSPGY